MVDTSKIHGHGNEKGKKNNGKHKKNRLFGKTSPTNTNDLTFDKEKINAKKRKKMKGILILKTANEFEGNSTLTPVHKICHKSKSLDLVVTREKNNENSETNKSSKKKRKNNKGGNKEEYSDKDDKVHDAVDNDGNPKYARLIDFNDEELLNSDKVEEKSRNKSKSTTSKKATQEKSDSYIKHNKDLIYYSPIKGNVKNIKNTITLGLHIRSTENEKKYRKQIEEWKGPVILSVFMESKDIKSNSSYCAYCRINSITKSKKKIWAYFIYSTEMSNTTQSELKGYLKDFNCNEWDKLIEVCNPSSTSLGIKIKEAINYPINAMRNIIYKETKSNYVVLSESDQYFSYNFYDKVLKIAKKKLTKKSKNALIFRSFEINHSTNYVIKNKKQLNELINNGHASEFEQINISIDDKTLKLEEWLKSPEKKEPSIQYEQPYNNGYWEPQIITRKDIPLYEETFPYPLDVTTEHRREMCRAGYHFLILNDVFAYHQMDERTSENILFVASVVQGARIDLVKAQSMFYKKLNNLYPETKDKCFV
ncbi:N-acetyllactosaminide beta-1,3-N-acetylglucosaminyltransferase [Strongyloides ratti]|uniref:N-acetyllactosaminide beta-1,3-N-acetylglucosaminyltransferase n=1 Tax=Strongyloides ratti TaxID=34506 RepID=A0A090KX36_STRRB|nr:N-acetyllactosaminide beta-1,3-N-acetylglucosaminyltransferase [Strongyloides ratti]CEF61986.1 N-acetyllactosaminide beta-1,3-N-acetylglucosaminyltransferase [Strongyloides ratti]